MNTRPYRKGDGMYPPNEHASMEELKSAVVEVLNGLETVLLRLTNECTRLLPGMEAEVANRRLELFHTELAASKKTTHPEK